MILNFFRWFRRTVRDDPSILRVGSSVCIVPYNGCMAHVRGDEQWGRVLKLENRIVYGSPHVFPFALIKYDDGREDWQPAAPNELQFHITHFERRI